MRVRSYTGVTDQSHRAGLNRRPLDYESSALPLSYCGGAALRHRHRSGSSESQTRRVCSSGAALRHRHRSGVPFPSTHPAQCPGTDSNRDASRHHPLKMACLPISPPGHSAAAEAGRSSVLHRASHIVHHTSCITHRAVVHAGDAAADGHASRTTTEATGLEPATSRVTVECSNQLSYASNTAVGGRSRGYGAPRHRTAKHRHATTRNDTTSSCSTASCSLLPTPCSLPLPIARTGIEPVSQP